MQSERRRRPTAARFQRRRRVVAAVLAAALVAASVGGARALSSSSSSPAPAAVGAGTPQVRSGVVQIQIEGRAPLEYRIGRYVRAGKLDRPGLQRSVARDLPATATVARGRARVVLAFDTAQALREVRAVSLAGATIRLASRPRAGRIPAPVIAQELRNNCESAALSILLATQGKAFGQLELQRAFPRSGTPDPVDTAAGRRWGDPERGYVGRPEGGGVAGGFGVYPGPVASVAASVAGERLENLTGRPASAIYSRLRAGRAVMAWIGLSAGPYGTWTTPAGRSVKVNFGEHTVVLYGITEGGELLVSNPLLGTRERWTQSQFETLYARLGQRALATT